ncbi:hypothetical protein [Streptomyces sp. NPDC007083]|uniref:hypothetical protein n=1 Tax=Streptomyces sp. NPDC007083 TaxID=3156913 RepID=UPI0033F088A8
MTSIGTQADSDEPASGPDSTYDLIICRDDRIVFHDRYDSPAFRLRMLVQLLTVSDIVASAVNAFRANEIHELHQSRSSQWSTRPPTLSSTRSPSSAAAGACRST